MMYDFTYRSASAPTLGVFAPLKIEGAPGHGTIADAQVWAEYYEVRISLYDGRGRWLCDAHPNGKVMGVTQRLLDMLDRAEAADCTSRVAEKMRATGITREDATKLRAKWLEQYPVMRAYFGAAVQSPASPAFVRRMAQAELDQMEARKRAWALGLDWQAEVDGAAETGESVAVRVGRLWDIENTPSDDLAKLDQIYLSAPPCQRERAFAAICARTREPSWSHVRALVKFAEFGRPRPMRALGAMSGKTAFADDLVGLRRLQADMNVFRRGRQDEVERLRDVGLRRIDFWQEPPVSLTYDMVAAFRGQTCPDQFEVKTTPLARARHLSGVSVDLLLTLGQHAQRLGFWGPNEVDLFDTNGGA